MASISRKLMFMLTLYSTPVLTPVPMVSRNLWMSSARASFTLRPDWPSQQNHPWRRRLIGRSYLDQEIELDGFLCWKEMGDRACKVLK
ncbi:hypothetical protein C0J50_2584 [Silurus asotus]|uniref:Uncharacterized protein n=1 Tax=Silurus asotus TaxID=30991 RepID=A0AAD5B7G8_SILAS|nr:hypothetical protein C0J50_2584 [Silurus asotus]